MPDEPILERLARIIDQRRQEMSDRSYTAQLIGGGLPKLGEKLLEEAQEVIEAADMPGAAGREKLIREAADLVFHLMVLLALRDAGMDDVERELERRLGVSGLDEKASRGDGRT